MYNATLLYINIANTSVIQTSIFSFCVTTYYYKKCWAQHSSRVTPKFNLFKSNFNCQ